MAIASIIIAGAKCEAKANCNPRYAATCAPKGARSEDPDRHVQSRAGNRLHRLVRLGWLEIAHQLDDFPSKAFLTAEQRSPHCAGRDLVRTRRAAKIEIDAPRMQCRERAELLRISSGACFGSMIPQRLFGCC